MYSHLSKEEKLKQLAQDRKRAIIWSVQQQISSALRKSSSKRQTKSTPTVQHRTNRETLPFSTETIYTPISLSDNQTHAIQAIEQALQDLQEQKEAIDITIDVLQSRLQFLLSNSDLKPKARRCIVLS